MSKSLYQFDKDYLSNSIKTIVGIDEAGRGPLAGPVVASAIILNLESPINGINDSKALTEKKRNELFEIINEKAFAIGIGIVDNNQIDKINILNATKEAMKIALSKINEEYDLILVDYINIKDWPKSAIPLVKGDAKSASIAAASIIAKVTRDRIMSEYHTQYPQYNFASHKGYPTKEHIKNISINGPCKIHRFSFKPLKEMYDSQLTLL
jgi:ribonuclease HII